MKPQPTGARDGASVESKPVTFTTSDSITISYPDPTKRMYGIARNGIGNINVIAAPVAWHNGFDAILSIYFDTYAEARQYAQRTTEEAEKIARQNKMAAWALPEQEPEEAE